MSKIKLRRSANTGLPANGTLLEGEVAYSFAANTDIGGKKLYIGSGDVNTSPAIAIGGEYYTSKLDHIPGQLVGGSAIIVDAGNRINQLLVGDANGAITITNSSLTLPAAGYTVSGGAITFTDQQLIGLAEPTANTHAATKKYVDTAAGGLSISANGNTGTIISSETLVVASANGVTVDYNDSATTLTFGLQQVLNTDSPVAFGSVTAGSGDDQIIVKSDAIEQVDPKVYLQFNATTAITANTFTINNHGLVIGDQVTYTPTSGATKITGLDAGTTYFVVTVPDDNSFTLSTSSQGSDIDLGTGHDGTQDVIETADNPVNLFATTDSITIGSSTKSTVAIQDDLTVGGNAVVTGDLRVLGTTTTVDSTVVTIKDPVIEVGESSSDDGLDRGIKFRYNNSGAKFGFFGFRDSDHKFTLIPDATNADDGTSGSQIFTGTAGTLVANLEGDVTGNADTASGFDGDRSITIDGAIKSQYDDNGTLTDGAVTWDGTGALTIQTRLATSVSDLLGNYIEYVTGPGSWSFGDHDNDANTPNQDIFTSTSSAISVTNINAGETSPARVAIDVNTATTRANATDITKAQLGVASFSSLAFSATNGFIDLNIIDGGTYGS